MPKVIKSALGNFLATCLIFLLVTVWIFSGWPQIFNFPPKVGEAYALTTTKTFTFETTAENFVGTSATGKSTLTYDSGVGNPAGSLKTDSAGRNNTDTPDWTWTGTWEDLEVPTGSTVTQIRLDAGYTKVTVYDTVDSLTIGAYKLQDSGGVDQATLWAGRTPTAADTDWVAISAQDDQAVPSALQASNSTIKLYLGCSLDLGNSKTAQVTLYEDQLSFVMTYTAAAPTLSFSISDNTIGFGALNTSAPRFATGNEPYGSDSETSAHTLDVSISNASGYSITVKGKTLATNGYEIEAIGETAKDVTAAESKGTEQFGIRLTVSGGGSIVAPYNGDAYYYAYAATATTEDEVASFSGASDTSTFSVYYAANISTSTEAGTYTTALTYICTGTF